MHIRHLHVEGIKLFRNLHVDFQRADGSIRQWTVVLGENGLCKTTLLHSIALSASGQTRANQLANVPSLPTAFRESARESRPSVSLAEPPARIIAEFGFSPFGGREYPQVPPEASAASRRLESRLDIPAGWSEFTGYSGWVVDHPGGTRGIHVTRHGSDALHEVRARNLPNWFVAGFGVGRRLPAPNTTSAERTDPAQDRLRSLFSQSYQLVGTDFIARFEEEQARAYVRILRDVLIGSGLLPDVTGIELRGKGGVTRPEHFIESHRFDQRVGEDTMRIPATWLSHGYQSTIAWVADLVGQLMLDAGGPEIDPAKCEGIVLVDEIDLHLHPRWQRSLVTTLRNTFPRLQFIATTHSPMVLTALQPDEVLRLKRMPDGTVEAEPGDASPRLMTGTELLQSFFGITETFPTEAGQALHRYEQLASNPFRTDAEERELGECLSRLRAEGIEPHTEPEPRRPPPELPL